MHLQLELGELRLAEHGPLDALEVVPEHRQPRVVVLDRLQHVIDQERLVERGGHFRDERRIAGQRIRLRLVRKVAVHRVPQFVGHRAHVVVLAVVVHEHVRMDVIGAAVRVGARPFAGVREEIDPSLVERPLQHRRVLGSERRQRREHVLLRFLRRVRQIDRADERRVQIVVVQLVEAHHPLPQFQVAVERRQRAIDAVDRAAYTPSSGCSGRPAPSPAPTGYFRAFAKNSTFWTSPFIVVPNVRLKLPSAWKNADITFWRSPRLGSPRSIAERRGVEFHGLAVAERDGRVGKSAFDRML